MMIFPTINPIIRKSKTAAPQAGPLLCHLSLESTQAGCLLERLKAA